MSPRPLSRITAWTNQDFFEEMVECSSVFIHFLSFFENFVCVCVITHVPTFPTAFQYTAGYGREL